MLQTTLSTTAILLALSCALLVAVRNRGALFSLVLAALLTAAAGLEFFDLMALTWPDGLYGWKRGALTAGSLLPPLLLLFSLTFARDFSLRGLCVHHKILLGLALLFPLVPLLASPVDLYYSPDFEAERILFLEFWAFVSTIALLVFLIIPLIILENTLANAPHRLRWSIKFVILGVGCYVVALLFYYSQGLLYRTINMNLMPLRSVALAAAALLVGYSQVARGSGVRIAISRNVAFQSVVLLAVSLYLIGLGLLGEGMKHFGESFHRGLLLAVGLLAGLGLVIVLLSEGIKRRIKGYLTRHFYEDKHDYRQQWLLFTTRMSMPRTREDLYNAILLAFADTFGMGCAALFLKDFGRQQFVAVERLSMGPVAVSFDAGEETFQRMAGTQRVFRIDEQTVLSGPQAEWAEENTILFLVPLCMHEALDGFVALGRPIDASEEFTEEDTDLMMAMVRQAASSLLNLRLAEQLSQSRDMEAVGKVSAFVAHDLKNLVYSLSLMLENARSYMDDPEFQSDMLQTVEGTVSRMKIIIAQLKALPEKRTLDRRRTDLGELAADACELVSACSLTTNGDDRAVAVVDREEMHKVLLNLLLNAVDATDGKGEVVCRVGADDQGPYVAVEDTGCGIEEDFLRKRLFQPFATTKAKGLGIGLYQCKQIVEAHGGRIEVKSAVGVGTVFTVRLPGESADKAVQAAA
jgi:putative PEP-CTERM system histidine kinase